MQVNSTQTTTKRQCETFETHFTLVHSEYPVSIWENVSNQLDREKQAFQNRGGWRGRIRKKDGFVMSAENVCAS